MGTSAEALRAVREKRRVIRTTVLVVKLIFARSRECISWAVENFERVLEALAGAGGPDNDHQSPWTRFEDELRSELGDQSKRAAAPALDRRRPGKRSFSHELGGELRRDFNGGLRLKNDL